ncbi:MAG: C25 family cysteine peptidase [Ginsengibacter sp.]
MKKLLIIILFFITGMAEAQTYSNSWIDYSKTYYKFKVGQNGLYHITQATLNSIGLGNVPAEQFQLWRNGEQVAIYTSSTAGILPSGGYIEFWGLVNDGKIDTKLYRVADYQLTDHTSLQTDTSAYFLTINTTGSNLRFTDAPNNVASNTLAPEPYFMNKKANYFKTQLNPGYASVVGSYVYSSSYDIGEGWVSADIYPGRRLQGSFNNCNVYAAGPGFSLKFAAVGSALNDRNVRAKIFNTAVDEEHMPYFTYLKKELKNLPMSYLIDANNIQVYFENTSTVPTDRMLVAFDEVTYPSKWIFNDQTNFYFELPATNIGNYLVITRFSYGSTAPVLFDLNSNRRYTGDISTPGKVKFALPASSDTLRKFELVSEDPSAVQNINSLQKRNFLNFKITANQGDYLIISNPLLYTSSDGVNNVDLYSQYRHSPDGGGFDTKIIDINELEDQFAYGIKKHPSAIKDFIQFAANNFSIKPKYVFLVGKGIEYDQYTVHQSSQYADRLNLVPTFGAPASDVLLSSPYGSIVPTVPIGRLSAISGNEVGNYLEKVKTYEQADRSTDQTLANKLWMKKVVNIVGGRDSSDNDLFGYYMNLYKDIVEDTLYGANVETFSKSSSAAVQLIASQRISDLFKSGISMLAYFGHSSSNILEFNLSDPSEYDNEGRYPFFLVSGCTAGNNYIYDSLRIINNSLSISENFVLSKQRGSIGFLASSHLGIPPYLNNYNQQLFHQITDINYGKPIGDDIKNSIQNLGGSNPSIDFFTRMHLEEMALHGDPYITINPQPKPDYAVEDQNIVLNPQFISVSEKNFTLQAKAFNIGRAINDSIIFEVKRTYPNGSTDVILRKKIRAIYYSDSINITVPIISTRDKGLNKITVTIDADNKVDEMSESNNSITKEFYIYEDEARPAYPSDYSIVNVVNQKLFASTSNAVSVAKDYVMEIDTTALFNSPFKISKTVNQAGGVLEFNPGFNYTNNTVYYWRVAVKPASGSGANYRWNVSSFIYLANSSEGSNQSHYYQQLASDTQHIHLDSTRQWHFGTINNYLESRNGVYPTASYAGSDCTAGINGVNFTSGICPNGTNNVLIFNVVNPTTLKNWVNTLNQPGLSGSLPTCIPTRQQNFTYDISTPTGRVAAMNFMDSIPDNYFVYVRNICRPDPATVVFADQWQADTSFLGSGNSLYHRLKSQGFVLIDSFYRPRAFSFIYQKNNPEFGPGFEFTKGISDVLDYKKEFTTTDTLGYITSPQFGPATSWKEMHWRGTSLESNSDDNPTVQIIGIDTLGNATTLFNVNKSQQDVDISSVNAARYPYIQLKMRNADSLTFSPYQLSYWRLNYQMPPEGALTPEIYFSSKDTLEQGEILHFGIAFKNISLSAFDSLKVKLNIIDHNNVTHVLNISRQKPLVAGDTIKLNYDIDTKNYPGLNTIYVNFNPDNDQPEQYLFNNFLYQNFYVKSDNYNPTMDVTFDGVHILNKDIVSARPHIIIKLKDENKSLALNDTSLLKVQIQYPDGHLRTYRFDNDTMRFTPANLTTGENTASIDLTPALSGEDADYELIVSGKDVVGNEAGKIDYHVDFRVISKPMISNMMNYPNPFTTSTAFVFTITGSEVPQNIRIQILTITGKVIREISENELGPLHIGRNITDFKWDGSDMYGQKVANGVYLYRVLTNLNGKSMGKFKDEGDNTDKYFNKGYGKMYFMR